MRPRPRSSARASSVFRLYKLREHAPGFGHATLAKADFADRKFCEIEIRPREPRILMQRCSHPLVGVLLDKRENPAYASAEFASALRMVL